MAQRKSNFISIFDDLRSEDPKRRLQSVRNVKELARVLGPNKTRSELIPFLSEFVDDDQAIILQLLQEINSLTQLIGGIKYDYLFLPFLTALCNIDEKKIAIKSTNIINRILSKNNQLILQIVKQFRQVQMVVTKHCLAKIISHCITYIPNDESVLVEYYEELLKNSNVQYQIVASQYIQELLTALNNKQLVGNILYLIYSSKEELIKLYALGALIQYYEVQPNTTILKIKSMLLMESWRINLKILQMVPLMAKLMQPGHLKTVVEQFILRQATSPEPQTRAATCRTLQYITATLNHEEILTKLLPIVEKLCKDSIDFVKVSMCQHLLKVFLYLDDQIVKDYLLPLLVEILQSKNQELILGIFYDSEIIQKKLGAQKMQQVLLKALFHIFSNNKWRIKCKNTKNILLQNKVVIIAVIQLTNDHIDAVRQCASTLLTTIILKQSHNWVDNILMPKINILNENKNYSCRQNFLKIIQETYKHVSEQTRQKYYKPMLIKSLKDDIPNLRAKALGVLKQNKAFVDKTVERHLYNLKDDKDKQVIGMYKSLRS